VIAWIGEFSPLEKASLNVLWTNGENLVGARLNRSLWYLERQGLVRCPICGKTHVHHEPKGPYRAVEIASEPITDELWRKVPNGTVFAVDPDFQLRIEPMGPLGLTAAGVLTADARATGRSRAGQNSEGEESHPQADPGHGAAG
jgi:hypothetical protein